MPTTNENKRKEIQRKADAKRAATRARAWTAVIYPDSVKDDWQDILANAMVEALVSPLHDKDTEPTGEPKKAHRHVVISFKNPASYDKAKEILQSLNAVVPPAEQARVKDFRQMARYLCHLDQPNKHTYSMSDVLTFGGLDYQAIVMTGSDEDAMLDEIEAFIRRNRIISFSCFQDYVRENRPEWRHVIRHKAAYYIRETIKSNLWDCMNAELVEMFQKDMKDWK